MTDKTAQQANANNIHTTRTQRMEMPNECHNSINIGWRPCCRCLVNRYDFNEFVTQSNIPEAAKKQRKNKKK